MANGVTLTAWLEASARLIGAAGAANGFTSCERWTTDVSGANATPDLVDVFRLARAIDMERRARSRSMVDPAKDDHVADDREAVPRTASGWVRSTTLWEMLPELTNEAETRAARMVKRASKEH